MRCTVRRGLPASFEQRNEVATRGRIQGGSRQSCQKRQQGGNHNSTSHCCRRHGTGLLSHVACLVTSATPVQAPSVVQCYKHVCALVERHIRKAKPAQRLSIFYLISAICRHSKKKHKLQDKYSASSHHAKCRIAIRTTCDESCACAAAGRWAASIAELTGLLQGLSTEQLVLSCIPNIIAAFLHSYCIIPAPSCLLKSPVGNVLRCTH